MSKRLKKANEKRSLIKAVTESTDIVVDPPLQHAHSLRIRGKDVDISCSNIAGWITLTPVSDITRDLRYCPHCGQGLSIEILHDKLTALLPSRL